MDAAIESRLLTAEDAPGLPERMARACLFEPRLARRSEVP